MFTHRARLGSVELAFTGRLGGVSAPPYDELDLALPTTAQDARGRAAEINWQRVMEQFAPGARRADMRQVHGNAVAVLEGPGDALPECDALVTTSRDVVLVVRVADCVPVLLADADAGVIAAVHVGRAGMQSNVLGATAKTMTAEGAKKIRAWVGPHVCGRCYEVPAAMRSEVDAAVPGSAATTSWGTPSLDLAAGVRSQLEECEIVDVHEVNVCTLESPTHYSHRRDNVDAGRQVGIIVMRGEGA